VFVLRHGEPMKIVDLAKNLIHLSGKELVWTPRCVHGAGREKLHEELIVEGEDVSAPPTEGDEADRQREDAVLLDEAAGRADRVRRHRGGRAVVKKLDSLVNGTAGLQFPRRPGRRDRRRRRPRNWIHRATSPATPSNPTYCRTPTPLQVRH